MSKFFIKLLRTFRGIENYRFKRDKNQCAQLWIFDNFFRGHKPIKLARNPLVLIEYLSIFNMNNDHSSFINFITFKTALLQIF